MDHIGSPVWTKNKKATINPISTNAVTGALNHEKLEKNHKEHKKYSLL